jgi:Carboxypeptidase regulatory-like domain
MNSESSSLQRSRTTFDSVLLRKTKNENRFRLQHYVVAFVFVICLALTPMFVHGQAISGNLTGTVTDPSGAVVSGAKVEATNVATGQTLSTTSRGNGEYVFTNLPIGTYKISVSLSNFKTTTIDKVPVELNKTNNANVKMEVGSSSTTVEVSGEAPPVDTATAQLQTTYNDQLAQDLGLTSTGGTGAGVLNLSMLNPGVTNANAMGDGMGPSVGGQRPRDNNFMVEGVDNNDKTVTGALITVPPEAVENFTLIQNQFNSDFGHSSGGQFSTTVKSGTNTFHGSLYEYFRNRNLNAVDETWVQQGLTSNPRLDNNRFGGTFGGPIIKNKLFFFTNLEHNPIGYVSVGGGTVAAPTVAGLAAIATDPGLSQSNLSIFKQYVPIATTPSGCITYNGTALSGAETFSTFSAPANGTCAAGSVEVGNVPIVPATWVSFTNFVQSVDYNRSDKDQFRFRYIYNKENELDNAAQLAAFFTPLPISFDLASVSEYHTFSPYVSNEFRFGFNRFDENIVVGPQKYPGLDAFPNITVFDLGSGLNVGPDPNAPQFTVQNFYQFVDNVSWLKGKHNLKIGAEYRWYISPQGFTQRSRGDYEYNATQVYLEDFGPDSFGQRSTGSTTYYGNEKAIYWYLNDTWKTNQHLSLNLGVRYEYTTTPIGENRQTLNAISNTPSILVPQANNQALLFKAPHAPTNNWAPRFGFAYSPGSSGDTSIRGGFGMAWDTLYDNIGILAVPPQVGSTTQAVPLSPNFLANGGLKGTGGTGVTVLDRATALSETANWIPPNVKDPYSVNWNFGVQHSFAQYYMVEVNYVGTVGHALSFQDILTWQTSVTPTNFLPTYLQAPSQATLNALPLSLGSDLLGFPIVGNVDPIVPAYAQAGFGCTFNGPTSPTSPFCTQTNFQPFPFITAFIPAGWSKYNGLDVALNRRMSNGLIVRAAYTWSHNIDNSTADFHTTNLTPRRPQDFFSFNQADKANSALDRAQRFTLAMVYDLPYFRGGNWFRKNVIGNWMFSPLYTYESGEWVTVQSGQDVNLNIDDAGDRVIYNAAGVRGTGSDVTPLCRVASCSSPLAGPVVAYVATNPTAQYIRGGPGALTTSSRNTLQTPGTNNIDLSVSKNLNFTERFQFRLGAQFANIINHPQYIPGTNPGFGLGVNDVTGFTTVTTAYSSYVRPDKSQFNEPQTVFSSNARTIAITAKFLF